jgi:hypothetical protein
MEDEMGGACRKNETDEKCIWNVGGKEQSDSSGHVTAVSPPPKAQAWTCWLAATAYKTYENAYINGTKI